MGCRVHLNERVKKMATEKERVRKTTAENTPTQEKAEEAVVQEATLSDQEPMEVEKSAEPKVTYKAKRELDTHYYVTVRNGINGV